MADGASASGSGLPKAIGSLAKKSSDVTRQGTQKLKFTPVLPVRRQVRKEEVKSEPAPDVLLQESGRGRGRGRGRGEGGRGRGRGAPRAPVEMTASGPFAMGPAMGTARRSIPKSNFVIPTPANDRTSLGAGLKRLDHPVKSEKGKNKAEEDEDAYSEPDEGVEIIDMEDVRQMDWMAPETIKREKRSAKKPKRKVKTEESTMDIDADTEVAKNAAEVDAANALDLSESEEEEEYEDLIEHFANQETAADSEDSSLREERLYFFQFPSPFPTFHAPAASSPTHATPDGPEAPPKKVTFADDVKDELPPAISSRVPSDAADSKAERDTVDGMIGTLEVYRSGAVKMRLQNGILLDVAAATQPSFLQHATLLDLKEKHLTILGEVNKRFVVSPDVETLLTAMELAERPTRKQSATDAS